MIHRFTGSIFSVTFFNRHAWCYQRPLLGHFKEASRFLYYLTSRWSMKTWHFHNSLGYRQCLLPCSLKDLGVFHTSLIFFLSYRSKCHGQENASVHILGIIASLLHLQELKALETAPPQECWSQFISANSFVYCCVYYTSPCSIERTDRRRRAFNTLCAKGWDMRLWT